MSDYHDDYPKEKIGGGNPYYRCKSCKRSAPEINGQLDGHEPWCAYWQSKQAARAQPAQAGQVLTDQEVVDLCDGTLTTWGQVGLARAIEQAVLAKRVPMQRETLTLEQCITFAKLAGIKLSPAQFSGVLEAEVSEFELQTFANLCIGIVGKKDTPHGS